MKLITLKLGDELLRQVDDLTPSFGFANRTEFIRNALREKVEEYRLKKALLKLSKSRGVMKNRGFTDEEYELARVEAFEKIANKLR